MLNSVIRHIPKISTVILSWNRVYLLKRCIRSYLQTVNLPFELIVVDNNSTEATRNFIKKICDDNPHCSYIFLPRNEGGRALNRGLRQARGRLLHVSENDLAYKPGWDRKVIAKFRSFPELGQLSLFSPFSPESEESGEDSGTEEGKKSGRGQGHKYYHHQRYRDGRYIYVTDKNVGTSSIFRRELWERGLRWSNTGSKNFRFPDDYAFSSAVRSAGYLAAWNDEYLVENLGHSIEEVRNNLNYYVNNYLAKKRGLAGLQRLLQQSGYHLARGVDSSGEYKIIPLNKC